MNHKFVFLIVLILLFFKFVLLPWETVGVVEPNSQNMRSMRYLDFVSILFYGAMVLT